MYGFKAFGKVIEFVPSYLFSNIAINVLPTASAEPLIVWAKFLPFSPLTFIFALLAWKSLKLEQDDISLYLFWLGIQTSISKVLHDEKPISPVHNSMTWYGSSSSCNISSALPSNPSSAFIESSSWVTCTNSIFSNWCCLIRPFVSLP